ncbi:MAG: maltooligosyltrehalose trehalohydrolase [Pseudonocardiales bacterium]|nr:maltooligosyltrehalose trehalohydrolase [Pseudonocardiales bacterium]
MDAIEVWAPNASVVRIRAGGTDEPMQANADGWWTGPALPADTDYAFLLDEQDEPLPDPRSRRQPEGVHGPSRTYDDTAYAWQDADWRGRDLAGAVIYELHIGTFTVGGTFDTAVERLDHLVQLGVTHVQLLPVNDFNGVWNWGYDGVLWYAVHESYGGPDGLKRFVDAAHGKGLAVVLDVVYNHLGPSGNYLPRYGPYFRSGRNTWGDLINVAQPEVRRYVLDNALMWLRDYHVDALRLDAVHAIQDDSPTHVLAQLADEVRALAAELGRPLTLIAESDLNDPKVITPRADGGWGLDAQWDDDVHHALHALLTGERQGYYCDFGSLPVLAKTFTRAFLHDGGYSTFRHKDWGAPIDPARHDGHQFVVCLQNHDQVGNRAVGDRLPELTTPGRLRIGAVLLLTSPFTPMLWMGEEWAASTRWPFFTSHPEPELAEATGKGRLAEFAGHGWDTSQMIDPQDPRAYESAILDWAEPQGGAHAEMLGLYRSLLALRAAEPELAAGNLVDVRVEYDEAAQWVVVHRGGFRIAVNLAADAQPLPVRGGDVVLATGQCTPAADGLVVGAESAAIVRV